MEDLRDDFHEHYRKAAEEHDRELMKKHEVDLTTTLILVCCVHRSGTRVDSSQATLFCGVISAFIAQVNPQLESGPTGWTTTLFRNAIYGIQKIIHGNDTPAVPQPLLIKSERLEISRSLSHISFWFGRSGITLMTRSLRVSPRCRSQPGRTFVEFRCGTTEKISSNGWDISHWPRHNTAGSRMCFWR
jgi:hypothetical protein